MTVESGDVLCKATNVREACGNLKDFIESHFVVKSCFCGAKYQYSYGLSIYFPWSQIAASYWNLEFIKTSTGIGWGSFLNTYTLLSRREARDMDTTSPLAQVPISDLTAKLSQIRMADDRMADDRMADDRMMSGANGKNPIHSMRNPPVIFFPTQCLRDREKLVAAQEQFWKKAKVKT